MDWSHFYGVCAVAVVIVALYSCHASTIKYSLLLLASWALGNLAVELLGFSRAPMVIPAVDGLLACLLAAGALGGRNRPGRILFSLFMVEALVHLVAFSGNWQGSLNYYIVLNGVFGIQLLLVGGSGVQEGVARRVSGRHRRTRFSTAPSVRVMVGVERWKN